MPPRRRALVVAAAEPDAAALPLVSALLPVDSRARACCVCRAWRDALADPALWALLDLSKESGVPADLRRRRAVLNGAARRAKGRLHRLDATLTHGKSAHSNLWAVVVANGGSLRELRLRYAVSLATLDGLRTAAPLLQRLEAELMCPSEELAAVLRAATSVAALRLHVLYVSCGEGMGAPPGGIERVAPAAAALADATLQPELSEVSVAHADAQRPEVLDALVDAALARRLRTLQLNDCTPPAAAPLARLLAGGALASLQMMYCRAGPLFDAAGAALLATALRATTTLTSLDLEHAGLCRNMHAGDAVLGALVGHRSLRALRLTGERAVGVRALGAALAALVAADAPALQKLCIANNALGDVGLAPLVAALPRNRHLRVLDTRHNNMSEGFARERLLPAVRANAGLRDLTRGGGGGGGGDDDDVWPAVA